MKTFGEFFDDISKWSEETRNGIVFLKMWEQLVSSEEWERVRATEFSEGLFRAFAEDAVIDFMSLLSHTCTDALYSRRQEEGHAFLREVARLGEAYGLTVPEGLADVPLTPTEIIYKLQTAKEA